MSSKTIKTRRYCYTIHNYTKKDLKAFKQLAAALEKHRYNCFGLEVSPETGTPHIQGYIELNSAQRFTFLHNYFNFTRNGELIKFHIEVANGTAAENKKYCQKDGDFYEFGEPVTQGARTDLSELKQMVADNPKQAPTIVREHCTNFQQIKLVESLQQYYLEHRDPNVPPMVYWIFGRSGIGKTKIVYDTFDDVCTVSSCKWPGTNYNQNECLLFDDYRQEDLPFNQLLKITDRYPHTLEYKGGQIPLNSPFIIFTSPKPIEEEFGFESEDLTQLKRRVTQINLDDIDNLSEVDLRNLDDKFVFKHDDYSHQQF